MFSIRHFLILLVSVLHHLSVVVGNEVVGGILKLDPTIDDSVLRNVVIIINNS